MIALLTLQILSAYPPLTPAAAADVLRHGPGLSNVENFAPQLPVNVYGPPGPFCCSRRDAVYGDPRPPQRLDGTSFDQPPMVYGGWVWPNNVWWSSTTGRSSRSFTSTDRGRRESHARVQPRSRIESRRR